MTDAEFLSRWLEIVWTVVRGVLEPASGPPVDAIRGPARALVETLKTEPPPLLRLLPPASVVTPNFHHWLVATAVLGGRLGPRVRRLYGDDAAVRLGFVEDPAACPRVLPDLVADLACMAVECSSPLRFESCPPLVDLERRGYVTLAPAHVTVGPLIARHAQIAETLDIETLLDAPRAKGEVAPAAADDPLASLLAGTGAKPGGTRIGDLRQPAVSLDEVVLPPAVLGDLKMALVLHRPEAATALATPGLDALVKRGRGAALLFEGPPGTGKTLAAEAVARELGAPLLVVRWDRLCGAMLGEAEGNVVEMFNEAVGNSAVLLLDEADSLLTRASAVMQFADRLHNTMLNLFLTHLELHPGVVILTTNAAGRLDPALARRLAARIRFDLPGAPERERLWRKLVPAELAWDRPPDARALALRHPLSGARIRAALVTALRRAVARGLPVAPRADELDACAAEQVRLAVRDRSGGDNEGVDELGELRAPQVKLADVVLPAAHRERLEDLLATLAPEALLLFDSDEFRTRFRTARENVVLLEGPPGTGKTMTAEALAQRLGKMLLVARVDRLLSRWVGASERALAQIFDEAAAHDAVLLLDEADSLLSTRVAVEQSSDRMMNNLVNVIVTRLEQHAGLVVLTTNRASVLDPALISRVGLRLRYPAPDASTREAILRGLIPPQVTVAAAPLTELARAYPLDGRQLRTAVLAALRQMVRHDPSGRCLEARWLEAGLAAARRDTSPDITPVGFRM